MVKKKVETLNSLEIVAGLVPYYIKSFLFSQSVTLKLGKCLQSFSAVKASVKIWVECVVY